MRRGKPFLVALMVTLLLAPLLVACPAAPVPPAPPVIDRDADRIEITSDRSFVFTAAGQTAQLVAVVVREDGTVAANAVITFTSSHPEVVSVDASGLLTAQTDNLGSAVITVSSGNLEPVVATAVTAELTPETVYIEPAEVIAFDPASGQVTLARNAKTDALQVDDVLLSGDRAGLLHRVTAVSLQAERVVVQTVAANLTEAFENLLVEATGAELTFTAVLDGQDVRVLDRQGQLVTQVALRNMKCRVGGSLVDIDFSGVIIRQELRLTPRVNLDIHWFTVRRFDLYMDGGVRVTAAVGELTLSGGIEGEIECKLELTPIPLKFLPIVGPLGVGSTATPVVGFQVSAEYGLGSITVSGPRVDKGVNARGGLGYTNEGGFRLINEFNRVGDGVAFMPISDNAKLNQEFEVAIEPFLGANVGVTPRAGPIGVPGLDPFDFLAARVKGGAELTMAGPLSPQARGYRGPRWNLYLGASAGLDPLRAHFHAVDRFLSRVGIHAAARLIDLDLTLFEFKPPPIAESPNPTISATPASVAVGAPVLLQVSTGGAQNARAVFLAFRAGADTPITIAEATTDTEGNASATWRPTAGGDYDITVLIHGGIFGAVGFPYASATPARVSVTAAAPPPPTRVLQVSPVTLTFTAQPGGPNPAAQQVTVTNGGGSTLSWSTTSDQTWLTVDPASGSLDAGRNQSVSISVNMAGLNPGSHRGAVNFTGGGESQAVSVSLSIAGATPPVPGNPSPGSPTSPGPTLDSMTVTLSWDPSAGATHYGLGVRDLQTDQLVVDTWLTSTSHTVTLSPGRPYRWNVRACVGTDGNQCSAFIPRLYFRTPSIAPPVVEGIFVADSGNNRIVRMADMTGAGLVEFVTQSHNHSWSPSSLVVDAAGRVYMADPENGRIASIDAITGAVWVEFGTPGHGRNQFSRPEGIFVDALGRIYVADTWNHRIVRMNDMTGAGWVEFGTWGSGRSQFVGPNDLFVDALGRIYIADAGNDRIVRIDDMTGAGWVEFGTHGYGRNQFSSPNDLFVDALGRIYIADAGNYRIVRIDNMTGSGWVEFGTLGHGRNQFSSPNDLFVDTLGRIYVADHYWTNGRIVRMDDMTGAGWVEFVTERLRLDRFNLPQGIFVDATGRIYVADHHWSGSRIVRMDDMTGTGWVEFSISPRGVKRILSPQRFFVDALGRIYVADTWNHRIVRMNDMTGAGWVEFGTWGSGRNRFGFPAGLFVDTLGRIYIADAGNDRIVRIDDMTGGGWLEFGTVGSGLNHFRGPNDLFVDTLGRIYVVDHNGRIVRMDDMTGAGWVEFGTWGSGVNQFGWLEGIFGDAEGRIYVADAGNDRIVRIDDMTGAGWVAFGTYGGGRNEFRQPRDLFVDAAGYIYIADAGNSRIVRIDDMAGAGWLEFGTQGTGFNQFQSPMGVFVR